MFVDRAVISVAAGNGGNGSVSFHREKYVPAGGPDGGDGGRGGNIVLVADDHMSTLMDFRYKRKYTAQNGMDGSGRQRSGKDGEDLILKVPRGTLVRDKETNAIIKDMSDADSFILARGGRGGWGNKRFATAVRQAPRFAKNGAPGQKREVIMELKLLADVGLVGFPNVGKSSLLSVVSKAHPKIADYHFTTLFPNLGVVYVEEGSSFVMADIPGIIEGASEGAGLGHDFLRHIERCRLIIHVVDVSGSEGRDPIKDFETVNEELSRYNEALFSLPQLVAANKCDIAGDRELLNRFREYIESRGYRFFEISAATHAGVGALTRAAAEELKKLPPIRIYEPEYVAPEIIQETAEDLNIEAVDNVYFIEGAWMERLLDRVNLSDTESLHYFDRVLRASGLYSRLEELGIREGDTVVIYNWEFEYKK
jgi:GTP-binding protein